jgi:hypothetical protein
MEMVLMHESSSHCVIFGGRVVKSKKVWALPFKKSSEKNPTTRRKSRSFPRFMMKKLIIRIPIRGKRAVNHGR